MKNRILTGLTLVAGTAGAAGADTGFYALGEAGGTRLHLKIDGVVLGANEPVYEFGGRTTVNAPTATLGGGFNLDLGQSGFDIGLEGQFSFADGQRTSSYLAGSAQDYAYDTCAPFSEGIRGLCVDGIRVFAPQRVVETVDDSILLGVTTQIDYTTAALVNVGYTVDRVRISAGAGVATAELEVRYATPALDVSIPVIFPGSLDDFVRSRRQIAYDAESFSDSTSISGWTAQMGVDYQATRSLALGLHYRYANFDAANFSGTRIPQLRIGSRTDALQVRVKLDF